MGTRMRGCSEAGERMMALMKDRLAMEGTESGV
jgi:hypothetical protein